MSVKLVAISKPFLEEAPDCNVEDFIVYCARVSNPSNQLNFDTTAKLLKYCIVKKHWSIFETVSLTLEIKTTRDIGRQILRHRSFSFQEFSQRYAEVNIQKSLYIPREARLQDKKNRQNSITTHDIELQQAWTSYTNRVCDEAAYAYEWAIKNGIAKEQARAVLPEGLTLSTMYMSGTLRSWLHYCALRSGEETQKEHRQIAVKAFEVIGQYFPNIIKAFKE